MSFQIIVARYTENLEWVNRLSNLYDLKENNFPPIVVYNKGESIDTNIFAIKPSIIERQNIGREVESFLYHIIMNYDNLPDYLIFVQGDPFSHMNVTETNICSNIENLLLHGVDDTKCLFTNPFNEDDYTFTSLHTKQYFSLLFDTLNVPVVYKFSAGCQYIVPKKNILLRSFNFYSNLHSMTLNTSVLTSIEAHDESSNNMFERKSICGWTLERLLLYIFTDSYPSNPFMERKRYLVTGGAGFIGSNLIKELLTSEDTPNIVVIDNMSTGNEEYLNTVEIKENITLFKTSILDENSFFRVGKVDGIFHFSAMSKVLPSLENKDMVNFCVEQNILGTVNLLKYASSFQPPIKVIYSASSTCYGLNDIPNVETDSVNCQTPYALSKYCGELYCDLFYRLYSVPSVRLRYFMVYGPNEPSEGAYAVVTGIFLKRKKENKPLLIHGDGSQTRDFVHVKDVCRANILAMQNKDLVNDTINVGTGEMVSIKQLADFISPNQIFVEARKVDLKHTLADVSMLKGKLNWTPELKIKDYLAEEISRIN